MKRAAIVLSLLLAIYVLSYAILSPFGACASRLGTWSARYAPEVVCVGTARLLQPCNRRVDTHADADLLRAALCYRRPLLAHPWTFPGRR